MICVLIGTTAQYSESFPLPITRIYLHTHFMIDFGRKLPILNYFFKFHPKQPMFEEFCQKGPLFREIWAKQLPIWAVRPDTFNVFMFLLLDIKSIIQSITVEEANLYMHNFLVNCGFNESENFILSIRYYLGVLDSNTGDLDIYNTEMYSMQPTIIGMLTSSSIFYQSINLQNVAFCQLSFS